MATTVSLLFRVARCDQRANNRANEGSGLLYEGLLICQPIATLAGSCAPESVTSGGHLAEAKHPTHSLLFPSDKQMISHFLLLGGACGMVVGIAKHRIANAAGKEEEVP